MMKILIWKKMTYVHKNKKGEERSVFRTTTDERHEGVTKDECRYGLRIVENIASQL
jgi:hypothetical protein